jgi:multidrug efflux system outer membrane protein
MKKNKNNIALGFIIIVSLLFLSCKTTKPVEATNLKTLPESYTSVKDSINSANINWKQYFSDANLVALIDEALKNNLDLLMALKKIEMASSNVLLNRGALFPVVNGFAAAGQRKFGDYTMDWAGNKTTEITPGKIVPMHLQDYYTGLQTSWEIDVWGKLRNRKKAALARYIGSIEGKNFVITNLISEIAATYYELLGLDNELEIIKETIKLQEDAFTLVNIQKQAAVANELAVQQFEAQLLNSKALEFETIQKITECENKINFLLGRYPQAIVRDKSKLTTILPFQVNVGIPSDLLKNRPDIRQAEYDLIASKADVKAAKAAFYPSFNITGAFGFQAFQTNYLLTPESIAYNIFGNLVAPLINRSAIKAEFRTANATQQEALYNYQKSVINGYVEVYNETAKINNLEKVVGLKTQEADVLTKSIETSLELFKTGRASYIEVLMTQKGALESKLELVNAKQEQYNAVINIYKALGGGWK